MATYFILKNVDYVILVKFIYCHTISNCCSQLQCTNNQWVPAAIIENDTTTVTIQANVCPSGENIKGLRYEWGESPCAFKRCAIYETVNGLPGPPFVITDSENVDGKVLFQFKGRVHI